MSPGTLSEESGEKPKLGLRFAFTVLALTSLLDFGSQVLAGVCGAFLIVYQYPKCSPKDFELLFAPYNSSLIFMGFLLSSGAKWLYVDTLKKKFRRQNRSQQIAFEPSQDCEWSNSRCLLLGLAWCLMNVTFLTVVMHFSGEPTSGGALSKMAQDSPWSFLIAAVFCAPWLEEHIFRGLLYSAIQVRWGSKVSAVLVSALFISLHLPEVSHFWPALFGHIVFASVCMWLRVRSGSVYPGFYFHLAHNGGLSLLVLAAAYLN